MGVGREAAAAAAYSSSVSQAVMMRDETFYRDQETSIDRIHPKYRPELLLWYQQQRCKMRTRGLVLERFGVASVPWVIGTRTRFTISLVASDWGR